LMENKKGNWEAKTEKRHGVSNRKKNTFLDKDPRTWVGGSLKDGERSPLEGAQSKTGMELEEDANGTQKGVKNKENKKNTFTAAGGVKIGIHRIGPNHERVRGEEGGSWNGGSTLSNKEWVGGVMDRLNNEGSRGLHKNDSTTNKGGEGNGSQLENNQRLRRVGT